ncbi:hypothetical protein LguiB_020127 [Lonicera macranthoides]
MNLEEYGINSTITVGPWGGQDGIYWDDGVYSTIRQVEIAYGAGIDSIRFEYEMKGASVWSEKHGGVGSTKTDKIKLGYPDEFLTSIRGYHGSLNEWGPGLIRSLTFESNKRTYGPYGIEQGIYFSLPMIEGKIVGFHGKCGWYLDAIGVHLDPVRRPIHSSYSAVQYENTYAFNGNDKCGYSTVQGNLGKDYDVIVAFRRKDDFSDPLSKRFSRLNSFSHDQLPNTFSRQASSFPDQLPNSFSHQTSDSRDQFEVTQPKTKYPVVPLPIERVPSKGVKGVVTYGPWGGTGGNVFDDGIYDGIKEIKLKRNVGITSIRILYDQNGEDVWGYKNGGTGGFKTEKIVFDYPSEILTHITGYHGSTMLMGLNVLRSLTFHTTKSKYGPFCEEQGQQFSTNLREGKIVGFHGRKGLFVDAIGVHIIEGKILPPLHSPSNSSNQQGKIVHPLHSLSNSSNQQEKVFPPINYPFNSSNQPGKFDSPINSSSKQQYPSNRVDNPLWYNRIGKRATERGATEEAVQRIIKNPAPHGTGPWGGDEGKPWDDGVFTGIKQIILTRAQAICSIEIEYDRNGQSVWSVNHGGTGGQMAHKIKLEYPHEVVTCVSGYYGPLNKEEGVKVIKSLTFVTSRRKCGPFGEEIGTFFSSATTEGKVVGFHGRSGMYLDAVGVHMQHWLGNQSAIKPSSLLKFFS